MNRGRRIVREIEKIELAVRVAAVIEKSERRSWLELSAILQIHAVIGTIFDVVDQFSANFTNYAMGTIVFPGENTLASSCGTDTDFAGLWDTHRPL
jgi:hypothetical protein